jgi:hypothetical protein
VAHTREDIEKARKRRQKLITAVLDLLADPKTAPTAQECYHWQFVAEMFGSKKLLDEVIRGSEGDLKEELLTALLFAVMRELVK